MSAVPTLQQSPPPSLLCVCPGTALSDKKREAVLQMLESPRPHLVRETRTAMDVDREEVERIVFLK